jgi:hypothetical protein
MLEGFNMAEKINKDAMKKHIEDEADNETQEFSMSDDEKKDAMSTGFNPFWSTKNMEYNKLYKFRVLSEKIFVRKIEDKFADGPTERMMLTVQNIEDNMIYDIAAYKNPNKDGNFSSLTLTVRKLWATTDGNVKDKMISFVKRTYKHEKWGDTDSFTINLIGADAEPIK